MFERLLTAVVAAAIVALVKFYLPSQQTTAVTPPAPPILSSAGTPNQAFSREAASAPAPQGLSYGKVELTPDKSGQYHASVEIDGRHLAMLVDTGASFVALTYADAAAIGIRPMPSDFKVKMATANGVAEAALVRLREVRLETILVDDVPAIVMPQGVAASSLLGMSFLKKLSGFEMDRSHLMLKS